VTGEPSPVRGGGEIPRDLRDQGRRRVARLLGHNRERVSNCYLGQSVVMRSKPPKSSDPPAVQDGSHCE
jgi:hypothetical protein